MKRQWIITGLLVLSTVIPAAQAQTRTWAKFHATVDLAGEARVAEFTHIFTRDGQSPGYSRTLYAEGAGTYTTLLVIRDTFLRAPDPNDLVPPSLTTTIKLLSTGETLSWTVTRDVEIVVNVNGTAVVLDWDDQVDGAPPATFVSSASALLAARSQQFQNAIHRLAEIGTHYSYGLDPQGAMLALFFYPEYRDSEPAAYDSPPSEIVSGFDPAVHPPSAFDRLFGAEYFTP